MEVHVHMLASSEGELVLADNCLWLNNSLIIWPANVSLHIEEGIPTIRDESDTIVARVGEWITMGGGYMPHEHLVDRIRQQIPEACRRDGYWMAGPEITLLAGPLPTLTPLPSAGGSPLSDDPLPTDAQAYAERFGVSQSEALQRLRFQEAIGELNAALMSEWRTFAGLWIEHEPGYQIVVAFTVAEGEEILQPHIADRPFADYITVRQHRYTLVELEAAQREALTMVAEQLDDLFVVGDVDVPNNQATLVVGNPELLLAEIEAAGLSLPEAVTVLPIDPNNLAPSNRGRVEQYAGPGEMTIYLPHREPSLIHHRTIFYGRLVLDDNSCLRLQPEKEDAESVLVIWPYDYSLRLAPEGAIEILNGYGEIVANTENPEERAMAWYGRYIENVSHIPDMPIDNCPGPYWLLAPILRE
jgi:hypothetical protein